MSDYVPRWTEEQIEAWRKSLDGSILLDEWNRMVEPHPVSQARPSLSRRLKTAWLRAIQRTFVGGSTYCQVCLRRFRPWRRPVGTLRACCSACERKGRRWSR